MRHSTNFFLKRFISQVRLIATSADWADDTIAFIEGDFSANGGGQLICVMPTVKIKDFYLDRLGQT